MIDQNERFIAEVLERLSVTLRQKVSMGQTIKNLQEEKSALSQSLASESEKLHALEQQHSSLVGVKREKARDATGIEKELETVQAQLRLKNERIRELESECEKARESDRGLLDEVTQAEQRQKAWDGKLEKICQDQDHILNDSHLEVLDLQSKLVELESKLQMSEQQTADLQTQLATAQASSLSFQQQHEAFVQNSNREKEEAQRAISEKDNQLTELRGLLELVTSQLLQQAQQQASPSNLASQTQRLTVVIPPRAGPSVQAADMFRMSVPPSRRDAFRQCPNFADQCLDVADGFTRGYLMDKLGGSTQGVIARIVNKKSLSEFHDIGLGILCPQPDLNCWLPTMPGAHGYMFVGLKGPGKDHERFRDPEKWSLFMPKGKQRWEYYGDYEVHRDANLDLSVEEWEAFSDEFKRGYAACTAKKAEPHGNITASKIQDIQDEYCRGALRVPCTSLKCIGYNKELVNDLFSPPAQTHIKRPQCDVSSPSPQARPKRARVSK